MPLRVLASDDRNRLFALRHRSEFVQTADAVAPVAQSRFQVVRVARAELPFPFLDGSALDFGRSGTASIAQSLLPEF